MTWRLDVDFSGLLIINKADMNMLIDTSAFHVAVCLRFSECVIKSRFIDQSY